MGVFVGAMVGVGVGSGVGVFVGAMVGVGVGSGVSVWVGADVGVGVAVGAGATVGTVLANGAGVSASEGCPSEDWKSEHPVSSMARSIAPAHSNPGAMDFGIIALLVQDWVPQLHVR